MQKHRKKAHFFGNKIVDQCSGANLKKPVFAKICCKFLAFLGFFAQKMLKMVISTSAWSAKHPNAGRNIQHLGLQHIFHSWIWHPTCCHRLAAPDPTRNTTHPPHTQLLHNQLPYEHHPACTPSTVNTTTRSVLAKNKMD